ncbi:hypothetical protein LJC52_01335 [Bacteroidales bacterium OttesenSCG-928-A17]|nr:hypothetical protein [Bacteroidales bacterium OttesenSCG-928-A17]
MNATVANKQNEIARIALNTNNEEIITKLFNYAKKLVKKEEQKIPCQYTIEEVRNGINQSIKEAKEGKVTSYEAVLRHYDL